MGYGGALIYSGLARNLKKKFPQKKVMFVYPWTLDELIWRKGARDRQVWEHNPDIDLVTDRLSWQLRRYRYPRTDAFVVNLDDPRYFYWLRDYGDHIEYKSGKHSIQIACDVLNLKNCELRSKIVLTSEEETAVDALLTKHTLGTSRYICVEPHTKDTFTPIKAWFFERWQELVTRLNAYFKERGGDIKIAQIGAPDSPILEGVVNLVGQTSFRQTARVLQKSRLLVSAEGGLPHLS